jgi:hypothetical protein
VTPRINPEYGVWSPPGKIKSSDTVGTICHDGKLPNSLSNGVTPQSDGYHFGINIIVGNDATVSAPSYRSHRMAVANLRLSGLPKLGVDIALVRQGHGISNLWMMIVAHQVDMHERLTTCFGDAPVPPIILLGESHNCAARPITF